MDDLTPQWRRSSTVTAAGNPAKDAAIAQRPAAKSKRELMAALLEEHGPLSADQAFRILEERGTPMILQTVRARFNDLRVMGRIVATDRRAPASSERFTSHVWRLTTDEERAAILAKREAADE